jgi:CheY-like chemotaxis protein
MAEPGPTNGADAAPDRVLLVDDNPTNLQVLFQTLEGRGLEMLVARSGEEAIEVARAAEPGLILLDVMMPGIDGFETCRRLKEDEATRDAAVIFMSALTETKDKVRGLDLGAVDYITKPFAADEVIARVQTHLTIQRLRRQLARRVEELEAALAEVRALSGLLPICAYCKRIRDGRDYWHAVESYLAEHSDATFSHGVCPDCFEKRVKPELERL